MAFFDFKPDFFTSNQLAKRYRLFTTFVKLVLITVNAWNWYYYNFIYLWIYGMPNAVQWLPTMVYNYGAVIKYNDSLYVSSIDKNIGNNPFTGSNWILIANNIVGYKILSDYKPTLIEFEFILNLQFGGVFKQPNQAGDSDIKVIRNDLTNNGYLSVSGVYPARMGVTNSNFYMGISGIYTPPSASITLKLNPNNNFNKANVLKFAYKLATVGITINIK